MIKPDPMNRISSRRSGDERGATLMVVLVIIAVMGLLSGVAGTTWRSVLQQEREQELLFRGEQYRRAIASYYNYARGGRVGMLPNRVEDLLKDPRSQQVYRHLRRAYTDPFTGAAMVLIKDQGGKVKGVKSASELEPFKKEGFPKELEKLAGAGKYSDWQFLYQIPKTRPGPSTPTGSGTGLQGGGSSGGGSTESEGSEGPNFK